MAKRVFGIDIGTYSIKVVELEKNKDKLVVTKTAVLPFDSVKDIPKILKNYLTKQRLSSALANVTIPAQSSFLRLVKLPIATRSNIEQVIRYETQQQVPFPLDEVVWGYQICHTTDQEIFVLLVAIKKVLLDEYIELIEAAGFEINHLSVGTIALYNLLRLLKLVDENALILDIGHKTTDLIISDNNVIWTRTLPLGGKDIEDSLVRELAIGMPEARDLKEKRSVLLTMYYGKEETTLSEEQKISQAISSTLFDICTEVLQSINYFRTHYNKEKSFKGIMLTGGIARISNIAKFLEANLNMPVQKAEIAQHFTLDKSVSKPDLDLMATAIGASLKTQTDLAVDIDLLPQEIVTAKTWKRKVPYLAASFILLGVIALQFITHISNKSADNAKYLERLKQYSAYITQQAEASDKGRDLLSVKTKIDFLGNLAKAKMVALEAMDELAKSLPEDVILERLEFKKENFLFVMSGVSGKGFPDLVLFRDNLEKSNYFKQIKITQAFTQNNAVRFNAEVSVKKWHSLIPD